MRIIGALLATAALATLPADAPAVPAVPASPRVILLPAGALEADRLDPALRGKVTGLLSAALESGGGYEVASGGGEAAWELKLEVTGKGPWRISAQLQPRARDGSLRRFASMKHPFSGREDLTRAVDDLAAEIDEGVRGSLGGAAPEAGRPIPLSRALSASTRAVDDWLEASRALRSGDPSRARSLFDEALEADPGFCLAAVERVYLDLTARSAAEARAAMQRARAAGACAGPGAEEIARACEALVDGDAGASLEAAEALSRRSPQPRWGRLLRGLALGAGGRAREAADDWRAVTAGDPEDPRGQEWLGLALMATGDFKGAADAFARARAGWPDLLQAYALQAEALVRLRETAPARAALNDMKSAMASRGVVPDRDERNPDLLLGSVDLLEGHTVAALKKFEAALDLLEKTGVPAEVVDTLQNAVIEMRRDLIISTDPVTRKRQVEDALRAIDRFQSSQTPEHRLANPWELMRLRGLINAREGKTVEAWKIVDEIKEHAGEPGYSEYYEAYLSAVIMLKEGDEVGSTQQFERAAKARGRIVDLVDLAQMQGNIRKYKDSHDTYEEIARRLERYDRASGAAPGPYGELILTDPHLAAMIPIYHYTWARLAYETNNPTESRLHFNRMLKYLQQPDDELMPLVKEAYDRGARPE